MLFQNRKRRLRLERLEKRDLLAGDLFEPNDSMPAAFGLQPRPEQVFEGLSIHQTGDEDWFRITPTVPDGQAAGRIVTTLSFAESNGDLDLQVFDGNGVLLGESLGAGDQHQLDTTIASSEFDLFIRVFSANNRTNTEYSLRVQDPNADAASLLDVDSLEMLGVADIGFEDAAISSLSISTPQKQDRFKITPLSSGTMTVNLSFAHAAGDLDVRVRESLGGTIVGTGASASDDETVSVAVTAGEDYFIEVTGFGGAVNAYDFEIDVPDRDTDEDGFPDRLSPITVTSTIDAGPQSVGDTTLREAIETAHIIAGHNEIGFELPEAAGPIVLSSSLGAISISESLSIVGTAANDVVIDGGGEVQLFILLGADNRYEFSKVTLANGQTPAFGAAIRLEDASLTVDRSMFRGNDGRGAAIYSAGGNVFVSNSSFVDNTASQGIIQTDARIGSGRLRVELTGVTMSGNTGDAIRLSDGIGPGATLVLSNTTIFDTASGVSVRSIGGLGPIEVISQNSVAAQAAQGNFASSGLATYVSEGNNLWDDASFPSPISGSQLADEVSTNPLLNSALEQDLAGIQFHRPLAGSPAIDAVFSNVELIRPTSVVSSTASTDLFPAGNLIDGSGLSATPQRVNSQYELVTHDSASSANAWVTAGAAGDYYDTLPPPQLSFEFGSVRRLSHLAVWGYATSGNPNNDEGKDFRLEFSSDGGETFHSEVHVTHNRSATAVETIPLGGLFDADLVRMTITDNHFGASGASGGEGVGLGEVLFLGSSTYDQRGEPTLRFVGDRIDVGAIELQSRDFGDAPTGFPTLSADFGASHIAAGPRLGAQRDHEADGLPTTAAAGDDNDQIDDEDGVQFGQIVLGESMAGINIDLQNAASAYVDAWIDFDGSGVWESDEKILDGQPVFDVAGFQTLNFTINEDAVAGLHAARIRVSSVGGLDATGEAFDGEVEDYLALISRRPEVQQVMINDASASRSQITSLTVEFSSRIDHTQAAGAFAIRNLDESVDVGTIDVAANDVADYTVVTLRFDGASTTARGESGNSLVDGNYRLTIDATKIVDATMPLEMGEDHLFGDKPADQFFRFFGDSDGDRDVDGQDYGRFGLTFLRTSGDPGFNVTYDFDGDGDVDGQDYGQFGLRFLRTI